MQENQLIPYVKNTELCRFMPVPKSVLDMGLSYGAVIAYGLLLDRANLSRQNGWWDESGWVYVNFTVESLGERMHRKPGSVKNALRELEDVRLIHRLYGGGPAPAKIFLRLPAEAKGAEKPPKVKRQRVKAVEKTTPPADFEVMCQDMDRLFKDLGGVG